MNWITRIKKASERITTAIRRRATKSEIAASKYISCHGVPTERKIIEQTTSTFESKLEPVIDGPTLQKCQETVRKVPVPDHVYDYVLDLVRMARPKEEGAENWVKDLIDWGPGPRACQQLILGSKVRALLNGRFAAKVEDVKAIAHPVLRHRIVPTFNAEAEGITVESIIDRCIEGVPEKKEAVL